MHGQKDATELEVLRLGRQQANRAQDHIHRGRNHLEQVRQALAKLEGTTELQHELGLLMNGLSYFHTRMETLFSTQARSGGSRVTDAEFQKDLTGSQGKSPAPKTRKPSPSPERPASHPPGR